MLLSKNFELRIHIYLDDVDGPRSDSPRRVGRPKKRRVTSKGPRSISKLKKKRQMELISSLHSLTALDCWRDPETPSILRPNGQLGDYHCDSSADLVSSVLGFMKSKMGDNIDFILWTG